MINHEGHIAYLILLLDRIPIINLFKSTALVFDIRSQSGSTWTETKVSCPNLTRSPISTWEAIVWASITVICLLTQICRSTAILFPIRLVL